MNIKKVFGPYKRKSDGRNIVIIQYYGQKLRTKSYARYLLEQKLGRELKRWEDADHINKDITDDRIENLQVLSQKDNIQKSVKYSRKFYKFICPVCLIESFKQLNHVLNNWKRGSHGPFCSNGCAAYFSLIKNQEEKKSIQGRMSKLENETVLKTVGTICLMGANPITPTN